MIKLFSLKQQKKDEEGSARAGGSQKKASAAQLRITKGKVHKIERCVLIHCYFYLTRKNSFALYELTLCNYIFNKVESSRCMLK